MGKVAEQLAGDASAAAEPDEVSIPAGELKETVQANCSVMYALQLACLGLDMDAVTYEGAIYWALNEALSRTRRIQGTLDAFDDRRIRQSREAA